MVSDMLRIELAAWRRAGAGLSLALATCVFLTGCGGLGPDMGAPPPGPNDPQSASTGPGSGSASTRDSSSTAKTGPAQPSQEPGDDVTDIDAPQQSSPGQVPAGRAPEDETEPEGPAPWLGPQLALENGLELRHVRALPFERARLVLRFDAGTRRAPRSRPGLARLTAHCIADARMPDAEGKSLRQALAEQGASLHMSFGERYVRFELRSSADALEAATSTFLTALTGPSATPEFVRWRARWLREELLEQKTELDERWELAAVLGAPVPSPREEINGMLSLRSAAVAVFAGSYYRPSNALALVSTAEAGKAALARLKRIAESFESWVAGPELPDAPVPGRVRPASFAVSSEDETEVVAVVRAPRPETLGTAAAIAWHRLSLGGVGGLLGAALDANQLQFLRPRQETLEIGADRVQLIRIRCRPEQLLQTERALERAFAELASVEPDARDFGIARSRALLEWLGRMGLASERIFAAERLHDAELDEAQLRAQFESVEPRLLPGAAAQGLGAGILLRGPEDARPAETALLAPPTGEDLQTELRSGIVSNDLRQAERQSAALQALAAAREAIGGEEALRRLESVECVAEAEFVASVPFSETWKLSLGGAPSTARERKLLGGTILTRMAQGKVSEIGPGATLTLEGAEAEFFQFESQLLLPMLLRPGSEFGNNAELIGTWRSRGREHHVLRSRMVGGQFVQLSLDAENGLPRRIVYEEWQGGRAPRQVSLLMRAYQRAGAFRLPRTVFRYVEGEYRGESRLSWVLR
jgi:hypothetical protein